MTTDTVARGALYPRAYERPRLLDWLADPRPGHGLRFADDDGDGWTLWEYPRLAALVASAAERIVALRSRPEGVVSIATRTGPEFLAAFMGALAAGHTPSPLALPLFARDKRQYVEHVSSILRAADPALILADESVVEIIGESAELAGVAARPGTLELDESTEPARVAAPAELALLQFTSGSSGHPRGVRVTRRNLESNIAQIRHWLHMGPDDQTATWLPLYHDMGLIGCFLTPVVNQSDVWIMRPDQFIADPVRWLECFGRRGVDFAVGPNFGFALANKRIPDSALEGMDFSNWRVAIVGAERLDPAILGRFAARLEPYGFRATTFLPAYGLAEATLAVTGVEMEGLPRAVLPDWDRTGFGERVELTDSAPLTAVERFGDGSGWVMGCGRPHPGLEVTIVDEDRRELPEAHVGEIVVAGPTVADGYETSDTAGSSSFAGGSVVTGDAGFVLDGELFVLGRLGDSAKVRGRTVFAEDVEARIARVDGVKPGKCVALAGSDGGRNRLVAIVEAEPGPWAEEVAAILRTEIGADGAVQVLACAPGTIQRTSSGKPRRRVMWRELLEGAMAGDNCG